jgi:hypothetical protein
VNKEDEEYVEESALEAFHHEIVKQQEQVEKVRVTPHPRV